jgi:transcriptional regulator with XRE-family HTH domain
MDDDFQKAVDIRATDFSRTFGSLVRRRRQSLKMRQDQVALATGVGRRFLIDLERGKSSCHLGRSLLVAEALGLKLTSMLSMSAGDDLAAGPDLPDEMEEADGQPACVL